MFETDEQFLERMANTFGLPTAAEVERMRRIEGEQFKRRIMKILRPEA